MYLCLNRRSSQVERGLTVPKRPKSIGPSVHNLTIFIYEPFLIWAALYSPTMAFSWLWKDTQYADCCLEISWPDEDVSTGEGSGKSRCHEDSKVQEQSECSTGAFVPDVQSARNIGADGHFESVIGPVHTERLYLHAAVLGSGSEYFRTALQRWVTQEQQTHESSRLQGSSSEVLSTSRSGTESENTGSAPALPDKVGSAGGISSSNSCRSDDHSSHGRSSCGGGGSTASASGSSNGGNKGSGGSIGGMSACSTAALNIPPAHIHACLAIQLDSAHQYSVLQQALQYMYSGCLPAHADHHELLTLTHMADRLQAHPLMTAALAAWQALPESALSLQLACTMLNSLTSGGVCMPAIAANRHRSSEVDWRSVLCSDAEACFRRHVAKLSGLRMGQSTATLTTRYSWTDSLQEEARKQEAMQTVLGDALHVANTPTLTGLLMQLPFDAFLWWLRDMEDMVTDSEDTVLYLADKYVQASASMLSTMQRSMLRDAIRVPHLRPTCSTNILPHMRWAALSIEELLMVTRWEHAGEAMRASMQTKMPSGWQLPARAPSTYQPPEATLSFNRASLAAALGQSRLELATQPAGTSTRLIRGPSTVRDGIQLFLQLSLYKRDPAQPSKRVYWLGLYARSSLAESPYTECAARGRLQCVGLDKPAFSRLVTLGCGLGYDDVWHSLGPEADIFDVSSWEEVFRAEGPEVMVVCEGAGTGL